MKAAAIVRGLKAFAAAAVHYSGARGALAGAARFSAGGHRTLILSYHRVVESFEAESGRAIAGLLVSKATLQRQIDDLWRAGYEPTSIDDALEMLSGARRPRRDAVVITFDDGYRDVYDVAFPLLEKMGIPAVVYLPTQFIGTGRALPHDQLYNLLATMARRGLGTTNLLTNQLRSFDGGPDPLGRFTLEEAVDAVLRGQHPRHIHELLDELQRIVGGDSIPGALLSWDMCRTMARAGITLGAHTRGHSSLHLLDPQELREEIRGSREDIELQLGRPCLHFAYPNGHYTEAVVKEVVDAGFSSAVTTEDLSNRVGTDPFRLRRKTLWENHSRGVRGYSPSLTACQVDNIFGMIGLVTAVPGHQGISVGPGAATELHP